MNNNPFKMFDIKEEYFIDVELISKKYKSLQRKFHPDNFTNKTAKEKLMATQISADITDSYNLLLDPIKRGEQLLSLSGVDFSMQNYTSKDNSILFEQLQLREQLETIKEDEIDSFSKEIDIAFAEKERLFAKQIKQLKTNTDELDDIKTILLSMRFYQKIQQEIRQKKK